MIFTIHDPRNKIQVTYDIIIIMVLGNNFIYLLENKNRIL
jgi:hypothetical protein